MLHSGLRLVELTVGFRGEIDALDSHAWLRVTYLIRSQRLLYHLAPTPTTVFRILVIATVVLFLLLLSFPQQALSKIYEPRRVGSRLGMREFS